MREEHMIERQGKRYVLYAGLLAEAHEQHDLFSIDTVLVQPPTKDNGNVAIAAAVVTLDADLDEPKDRRRFTGIGDASPDNVNRNIAAHLIRMAETRAKARALRDAVNVGVTAFEELGGDDAPDDSRQQAPQRARQKSDNRPASEDNVRNMPSGDKDKPATEKQLDYLTTLAKDYFSGDGRPEDEFYDATGYRLQDLTRAQASQYINEMVRAGHG